MAPLLEDRSFCATPPTALPTSTSARHRLSPRARWAGHDDRRRPPLPFGVAELNGDGVRGLEEKPQSESWVNGGFFASRQARSAGDGRRLILEREPLQKPAVDSQPCACLHAKAGAGNGRTPAKDAVLLNDLPPMARRLEGPGRSGSGAPPASPASPLPPIELAPWGPASDEPLWMRSSMRALGKPGSRACCRRTGLLEGKRVLDFGCARARASVIS